MATDRSSRYHPEIAGNPDAEGIVDIYRANLRKHALVDRYIGRLPDNIIGRSLKSLSGYTGRMEQRRKVKRKRIGPDTHVGRDLNGDEFEKQLIALGLIINYGLDIKTDAPDEIDRLMTVSGALSEIRKSRMSNPYPDRDI